MTTPGPSPLSTAPPAAAARLRDVAGSPVRDILALTQRPGVISFAAGRRLDPQLGHLLLQALLHLLRLLHHLLDVHRGPRGRGLGSARLHFLDVADLRREHVQHRLHAGVGERLLLQGVLAVGSGASSGCGRRR